MRAATNESRERVQQGRSGGPAFVVCSSDFHFGRGNEESQRQRISQTEKRRKRSKNGGGSTAGLQRRPADADESDRNPRTTNDSRGSWVPIRFVRVRRCATPSNRSSPFVLCFLRCSVCESVRSVVSVFSTACCSKPQSALVSH